MPWLSMIEKKSPAPACASLYPWLALVGLSVLALALTGCGLLRGRPSSRLAQVSSPLIMTNLQNKPEALEVVQAGVMRFADRYAVTVAQAVDEFNAGPVSPQARTEALRWKLGQATAAWIDATGANPVLNALDLVVLATVSRMVMEDEVSRVYGPAGEPMLEAQRRLETNAWVGIRGVVKPAQQQQLHEMIAEWRRENPHQRYVAATRFRELAIAIGETPQPSTTGPNNIFSLLFLDPFAGLDPTAAAIQETRQLAERVMYYSQRMPVLLNWQVQLLALQLAAQPESKQLLADADRLTRATEAFAKVADQMPQLVNDQREAAIRQILEGVASERTNLLADLAAEETKARALLGEARQTLEAGSGMAVSVQGAIKSLDEFVRYVSPATNSAPPSTNSRPFSVVDYGQAASQVGLMAQDLQKLLVGVNQTAPELARFRQETTADAERVLHRAFWLGLLLSLIVITSALLAALAYRAITSRLQPKRPPPGESGLQGGATK